jgi:hypothetical protein
MGQVEYVVVVQDPNLLQQLKTTKFLEVIRPASVE